MTGDKQRMEAPEEVKQELLRLQREMWIKIPAELKIKILSGTCPIQCKEMTVFTQEEE